MKICSVTASTLLGSSLAVVAETSGTAATEARTLHERPAKIQELKWRAPYPAFDAVDADPVRDILFTFADGALYQIVVTYERSRVEGLTDADLIDVVSAAYGEPAISQGKVTRVSPRLELPSDTVLVARWDTAVSSVPADPGIVLAGAATGADVDTFVYTCACGNRRGSQVGHARSAATRNR